MKIQLNIYKKFCLWAMAASAPLLFSSCGDNLLESLDPNQEVVGGLAKAKTVDQATGLFLTAQQKVHDIEPHQYQYQFSLHIDNYCGYLSLPQNFDGRQPSTYYINKDFNSGPRGSFFRVSAQALPVVRSADSLGIAEIGAMANILYCYAAQELADVYGPFPWSDYKKDNQDPPLTYFSVKDIYDSIFTELRHSVSVLEHFSKTPAAHQDSITNILVNQKKDRLCGGKVDNWIRFANSLRLRMAMHISVVSPDSAKAEAKDAIQRGVLDFSGSNVAYDVTLDGSTNPLAFISSSWQDTRLNASFENLLKRMNNPLLPVWFMKNGASVKNSNGDVVLAEGTEYVGIRTGIATTPRNSGNQYLGFSAINTTYNFHPIYLMKVSEVQFLLAEATLRWGEDITGAPAQLWYENGVIRSLTDENIFDAGTQDAYLSRTAPADVNYTDYYDNQNNHAGLVTIGVAWNESDTREMKLEKIITQKYIANFPMSLEAWTDLRRTGFPKIFAVVDDDGDGSITEGDIIRRIPYIINDDSDLEDVNKSAVPLLGGPDLQGTRLWWDTGKLF